MKMLSRMSIVFIFLLNVNAGLFAAETKTMVKPGDPGFQPDMTIHAGNAEGDLSIQSDDEEDMDYLDDDEELDEIADPLEPVNRAVFYFNDKLYFWLMKPVAQGYSFIVPAEARTSIRNFFFNISAPVRVVNSILQLKIRPAGREVMRFGINSTVGVLGLFDVAKEKLGIRPQDEDFGQTLGVWGVEPVFFINWPLLGPSTLRDSIGLAGDYFLQPFNYVTPQLDRLAIKSLDGVNRTSLSIGDYEGIKKDALDPYSAVKDIYYQYRKNRISR